MPASSMTFQAFRSCVSSDRPVGSQVPGGVAKGRTGAALLRGLRRVAFGQLIRHPGRKRPWIAGIGPEGDLGDDAAPRADRSGDRAKAMSEAGRVWARPSRRTSRTETRDRGHMTHSSPRSCARLRRWSRGWWRRKVRSRPAPRRPDRDHGRQAAAAPAMTCSPSTRMSF